MSGPLCPDCGLMALQEVNARMMSCPICGWEGTPPPRKIMGSEMGSRLGDETSKQLKLREEERLTYFRVTLKGSQEQKNEALFDIMELMGLNHMGGRKESHIPHRGESLQ